ncbi:MAG TPA: alpha/beta fold hydrolase [Gammaproteobacteria bacterium]|nr:alpha/beta fold hydrolase [Gammaproteobacteria bacterium]
MNLSENVVLLHGLGRSSRHMAKLARTLEAQGYVVHNLDYPSRHYAVERLCEYIHEKLSHLISPDQKVHFVGYSLGGLLVRLFLSNPKFRPKNLGRVVQLAPPNKGTDLADFWQHQWGYKKIYGPAGQQIITDQSKISHLFSPIDYELGVIAGTATANPIASLIIKGKNDGRVSVENTKVEGMKEHIVLHVTHRFFPKNKKVMELTAKFLAQGTFG